MTARTWQTLVTLLGVLDRAGQGRGRVRIEHASVCPPDLVHLVAELNASAVTHRGFVHANGDRYLEDQSLAPHEWLYRLASWRRSRVPLGVGSDAPAGPADPLLAWRAAISRRTAAGRSFGRREALSPFDALATVTAWAADVSTLPDVGRLLPGTRAAAYVLADRPSGRKSLTNVKIVAVVNGSTMLRP